MIHHLRAAGVSFVLDSRGAGVPAILHWGSDLGVLTEKDLEALACAAMPAIAPSSIDAPLRLSLLATLVEGWSGQPALSLDQLSLAPIHQSTVMNAGAIESVSVWGSASIQTSISLTPQGVLLLAHRIRNDGIEAIGLAHAGLVLPVPHRAREVLDFSGRWSRERQPHRSQPLDGVWLRESRHGRGGHDDPFLMVAGTPGFTFETGEVWSTHVAWSGDTRQWFERSDLGPAVLGAGERHEHLSLAAGAEYRTPTVVATWSNAGLTGISDRLHPWIRTWSTVDTPRPLTLNTWEAVYFDHSLARLEPLVQRAADVGVERFVLDDGWFEGRTDDRRALGDWEVDRARWPDGLHPLIACVRETGMQFGLWVEPEMVNLDSNLARAHPEWLLTGPAGLTWRHQHVLDLAQPGVEDYLFERLDTLLSEYAISYLKWDHNRDLLVNESRSQVLGVYRLIDRLRAAHPGVEIESCASGGGRIDLEILRRVDRVWASDTNDPLERQRIQRWTGIVIPPEYLGAHVGDARAHTTGRQSNLNFRLATALFGHAGIESDLTTVGENDLRAITRWGSAYRQYRGLLHSGRVVQIDTRDSAVLVHGVVAKDRSRALMSYAVLDASDAALPAPLRLTGLDPRRRYRVRLADLGAPAESVQDAAPEWLGLHDAVFLGSLLMEVGLSMPLLTPGNALIFEILGDE
ncbi:alpha-galactosidase (plasmid) [Coraliomargarita sp. W4R53]